MTPQGAPQAAAAAMPQQTPEAVLAMLAQAVSQLAAASTSSSSASQDQWRESKFVKGPDVFNPKTLDEEIAQWAEWSFTFKNFMAVQNEQFREDFRKAESAASFVAFTDYDPEMKSRAQRLYAVLASYLRGRPLKILKSVVEGDGFRVWRQLSDELQPKSRPRSLALAQALTRFPPLREGGSVLEYTLMFERLVGQYEQVSKGPYPDDLKISTLLSGLPQDIKRYLQLQIDEHTTYEILRTRLLQFERTSATWSTEHVLKAIGVDKNSSSFLALPDGVVPMDVDRAEAKGKKGDKGKKGAKGKSKGDKGKKGAKGKSKGDKGKKGDKGQNKGKEGKGKASSNNTWSINQSKVGPCWTCGRMGHVSANCYANTKVNQVAEEDAVSTSTRASSSLGPSASVAPTTTSSQSQVRRMETIFDDSWAPFGADDNTIELQTPWIEEVFSEEEYDEQDWVAWDSWDGYVRRVEGEECEAPLSCSSTLVFCIADGDTDCEDECDCESEVDPAWSAACDLAELCSDSPVFEGFCEVRMVRRVPEEEGPKHQVILDSGADITVLPASMFRDVGAPSASSVNLLDAQGGAIPQQAGRTRVTFEVEGYHGERICFKDDVILASVKQPLLCLGKLIRKNWLLGRRDNDQLVLEKDGRAFRVDWSKNSLSACMKIYRAEASDESAPEESLSVRAVVELSVTTWDSLSELGWQLTEDGYPAHVALDAEYTVDPSLVYPLPVYPFRTTLLSVSGRPERQFEIFECAEYWETKPVMDLGLKAKVMITILTKNPMDPQEIGKLVDIPPVVPSFPEAPPAEAPQLENVDDPMEPEAGERVLGPEMHLVPDVGEVLEVAEKTLTPESTLREMRKACEFLGVPRSGGKAVVWARLKREISLNKLKVAVQASDAVTEAFAHDAHPQALPVRPDPATVALHELTHIPRMDWCESCQATRSREDSHSTKPPVREQPVVSMDFMFNRTGDDKPEPEHPMQTHLVVVDQNTKFVLCIPVQSKAAGSLKVAVEEIVKLTSSLGYTKLTLRADSEPAMVQLTNLVKIARSRLGFATTVEFAPPDSSEHQGLRAERYIDIVRKLGLCLLHTVSARTKRTITSAHPLYVWCFRHAAFLLSRFRVHSDGCTSFELVHGRKYEAKLAPFGSTIFAQPIPKPKAKGVAWEKAVFLGKSTVGNLNIISNAKGVQYSRTMRRAAEEYQADLVMAMRGVPWDPREDVVGVKLKPPLRVRFPVAAESGPPPPEPEPPVDTAAQDEAGSDPESPGSSILQGLDAVSHPALSSSSASSSASQQASSMELVPDHQPMNTDRVESEVVHFIRRADVGDFELGHEDDTVACGEDEELEEVSEEPAFSVSASGSPERSDEGMPWEGRRFEEGPPELSSEALASLDAQMEEKEIQRLLEMGVLRSLVSDSDCKGKFKLKCRYVKDWRYRGGWCRRARLVAKEYKFLEPHLQDIYSPASTACSQKLLACLAATNQSLELWSVDITDAYLQVPQKRPTYIETPLGNLELLYNLPGQRSGAKEWYEFFKDVVTEQGMQCFEGSPSLFAKPQEAGLNSHVDDFQVLAVAGKGKQLVEKIEEKGLKVKVEGPVTLHGGEASFLKKTFEGGNDSILVKLNKKYIERLVSLLGLEKASGKMTPVPTTIPKAGDGEPLDASDHALYRTCIGILLYISGDRPDAQYATKVLSSRCSSPTTSDLGLLRHVVKYLKNHQHLAVQLCATEPGRSVFQRWNGVPFEGGDCARDAPFGKTHLVEVVTDADWASQVFPQRRSISSFCIFVNSNLCHCGNRVQKSTSLSSAESELCGSLLGVHEALFVCRMLQFLCGCGCEVKLVHYVDNSAARAVIQREGLGKMKHIDLAWLWIQRAHKDKIFGFVTKPISTAICPADLATKSHPRRRSKLLCGLVGMFDCEHHEVFGAQEVVQQNFGSQKVLSKAQLFRVCVMLSQINGALGFSLDGDTANIATDFFKDYVDYAMDLFFYNIGDFIFYVILMAMVAILGMVIFDFFVYKVFELNNNKVQKNYSVKNGGHGFKILLFMLLFTQVGSVKYTVTVEVNSDGKAITEEEQTPVMIMINQVASTTPSSTTSASSSTATSSSTSASSTSATENTLQQTSTAAHQTPVPSTVNVYTIGHGKCFHGRGCGMVQRSMRLEPHKVHGPMSHREAQRLGYRCCEQCKPLSSLK